MSLESMCADQLGSFFKLIKVQLEDETRASRRQLAALVCSSLVKEVQPTLEKDASGPPASLPPDLHVALLKLLSAPPANRSADMRLLAYQELSPHYRRVQGSGIRFLKQVRVSHRFPFAEYHTFSC